MKTATASQYEQYGRRRSGLYVPKMVRGLVSDVKVFDDFDPKRGKGKLVDFHPGGENTITSGASLDLLEQAFFGYNGGNIRYTDINGILFPSLQDLTGNASFSGGSFPIMFSAVKNLFAQLVGINGGAAGIASHVTTLSNITMAWGLKIGSDSSSDWYVSNSMQPIWSSAITSSITETVYRGAGANNNVPAVSLNVTITSTAAARSYSIDSIGWIPTQSVPGSQTVTPGYFTGVNGAAPTFASSVPLVATSNANPSLFNNLCVSALYVLPYVVTVNPNGALQFTYTFQGA